MSTITINSAQPSLAWRFVWKEYRMLRGLWLAGLAIGALIQVAPTLLSDNVADREVAFFVAWVAAALYAVGAAITVFSGETEEGTRDYLRLLPADWRPLFGVKVLMCLVGSLALGCALTITAWFVVGRWPDDNYARVIFRIPGVAILEGLTWSLLFSLWWRHPLLAAVAGIAAASFGAQVAIAATTDGNNSWTADAYVDAVPGRLAICLAVFAVDVLLGRRWLYPRATSNRVRAFFPAKTASGVDAVARKIRRPRLRMFVRLLWQTCRESWRSMLVAVPLGFALVAASLLPALAPHAHDALKCLPFAALIPPALLGALAFRADWQRDHRLFLATHSAWPRYVWLARQVVWLGLVVLLGAIGHYMARWIFQSILNQEVEHLLRGGGGYFNFDLFGREIRGVGSESTLAWQLQHVQERAIAGFLTTWCAVVSAYGVGQLCSMLLRQSLLSGFLSVLLSVVLAAWSVLMFLWQMNPLVFVLPIGLAALLATWLRVPRWILEKNQMRHWLLPAAALVLPLVAMTAMVPSTRMAQLSDPPFQIVTPDESFEAWNQQQAAIRAQADATALPYEQLAGKLEELRSPSPGSPVGRERMEAISALAEEVSELTKEPYCHFPSGRYLQNLQKLLASEGELSLLGGDFDDAFERLSDRIRFTNHRLQFQRSSIYAAILMHEHTRGDDSFDDFLEWANHPDQTSERVIAAIPVLRELFDATPKPDGAVLVDSKDVRDLVLEKELPEYGRVALALNRLPGEQERALLALDILTGQTLQYVQHVYLPYTRRPNTISASENEYTFSEQLASERREILRTAPRSSLFAIHEDMYRKNFPGFQRANELAAAAATSFLVGDQFRSGNLWNLLHTWVEEETRRRALLVQLALVAYRIDHGEYPESLDELTPEYLEQPINDPFSGKPFVYRPQGLDLALRKGVYNSLVEGPHTPAGTALLWSVGNGNSQLVEEFEYDPEQQHLAGFEEPNVEASAGFGQSVYRFDPTERGGHSRENLVFPMAK